MEIICKNLCTGCGACVAGCPKNAISLQDDEEGVKYPHVDEKLCVGCNKCRSICPVRSYNNAKSKQSLSDVQFFAAQLREINELFNVSSGGAFWALAKTVIDKDGVVYGARQKSIDIVQHYRCENIETAKCLRRSKYLQSEVYETYSQVKNDLENGLYVLFSGTGCQVAGLYAYLGDRYDRLITCDVVCHGVPCGLAWKSYIIESEKKKGKRIAEVVFRDKSRGWNQNQYKILYDDGTHEYELSKKQLFHSAYLKGMFYRPSCNNCKFIGLPRIADITLADFWKYEGLLLNNGDRGISLVVANNEIGKNTVYESEKYLEVELVDEKMALDSCEHLINSPTESHYRGLFIRKLQKKGFYKAVRSVERKERRDRRINKVIRWMKRKQF